MTHQSTIDKILSVLQQLEKALENPRRISLKTVFEYNELASDYMKFLIEDGIIIKLNGGKAGPTTYQWNNVHAPTEQMAKDLATRYSDLRVTQKNSINERNRIANEKILETLTDIKKTQEQILEKLNHQ